MLRAPPSFLALAVKTFQQPLSPAVAVCPCRVYSLRALGVPVTCRATRDLSHCTRLHTRHNAR